jgi:hypothetical protein
MGIIRAIKSSELVGGNSDEHLYPVTSIKAIYDLNNKALDTILEEQNTSINDTSIRASELEATLDVVSNDVDNIKGV